MSYGGRCSCGCGEMRGSADWQAAHSNDTWRGHPYPDLRPPQPSPRQTVEASLRATVARLVADHDRLRGALRGAADKAEEQERRIARFMRELSALGNERNAALHARDMAELAIARATRR